MVEHMHEVLVLTFSVPPNLPPPPPKRSTFPMFITILFIMVKNPGINIKGCGQIKKLPCISPMENCSATKDESVPLGTKTKWMKLEVTVLR